MQVVLVGTDEGTVAFLADLVPTASHLAYPWIMGYDLEPLRTLASKKRLLSEAAAGNWRVVFEHDRALPLAVLAESDGKLSARPVESIS
jgi:glyoxylase-like metal-dependent hydrolase (beta-lactamase superfamily II)